MFHIYSIIWHTTNSCYHLVIEFCSLITEAEQFGLKNSTEWIYVCQQYRKLLLLEKDTDMALALVKQEYEHTTIINNLKWKLSHLTQRYVLEKFYGKFWSKLIENDMIKKDHKVRNFCFFC